MRPLIAVPATAAIVLRAYTKKSLTTAGILAATATAIAHAYHPWNLPFVLLIVFFLAGTQATHVKENVKATLTMNASGSSGGEGPRTHVQEIADVPLVFANSLVASVLSILHARQLSARAAAQDDLAAPGCFSWGGDLLVVGIIANYAAVAADTFSSELGILSESEPRLITSLTLRKVPRGTNGGVTVLGLGAGLLGSAIVVLASMLFLPMCDSPQDSSAAGGGRPWSGENRVLFAAAMIICGVLGSVLDSVLGAVFQRTVKDVRSGKVVEGQGGRRAMVSAVPGDQVVGGSTKRAEARASVLSGAKGKDLRALNESAIDAPSTETLDRFDPGAVKQRKPSFGDGRPSRVVENGLDLFDNNEVNFVMALTMSIGAMAVAGWYWGVPLQSVIDF